jgi:acetyl esterase/lipase
MTFSKRWLLALLLFTLAVTLAWLLATDNHAIWPVRNALQYQLVSWWWTHVSQPRLGAPGTLRGVVRNKAGEPVAGAWVLLSRPDGNTYKGQSDETGQFLIADIPGDTYRPVAGAPGYESVVVGEGWQQVQIEANQATSVEVVLSPELPQLVSPGTEFRLEPATELSCSKPLPGAGVRRTVHFQSAGQANQQTLYYTPVDTPPKPLPILLAIYPGPADSWECVSLPLAAAGYAVIAVGPAYTFDLESDLDELERVLAFAQAGEFPGADGNQVGLLGGSYSSLHVQRLLQRGQAIKAALLLGPPTDLFDMRRRLEDGTFVPPFGLDQAFYALGFPSQEPLRYWRYSGAYHVRSDFPPLAILHSRTDQVVPFQQSELLVAQLAEAGVPYNVYFFEGGGHYLLAEDGDAREMYEITLDFFAKHLPSTSYLGINQ